MRRKYVLTMLMIGMVIGKLFAQNGLSAALKIGEKVPDMDFNVIHPTKQSFKLSDFKGKVVILDFWTVSCTPCIKKLPYLDSILKANKNVVQIIAVNADGAARADLVNAFFKKYARFNGAELGMPVAMMDNKIKEYFPFEFVPHVVWIDREGVLRATTNGQEITENLIKDVYAGKRVEFKLKQDFVNYDKHIALFKDFNGGPERNVKYKSTLTGYLEGLGQSSTLLIDNDTLVDKFNMINFTFLQLYKKAYNLSVDDNKILLDSRHPEKFSGIIEPGYVAEKTFCYELIGQGMDRSRVLRQMRNDLSSYFGLSGKLEKRKVPCLVINRRTSGTTPKQTKVLTEQEQEMSVEEIVQHMNGYFKLPVINEVKPPDFLVKIKLPGVGLPIRWNLVEMRAILAKHGLSIVEEEKEMEVFVLQDVDE